MALYTCVRDKNQLVPSLRAHLESPFVSSVRFDAQAGRYTFIEASVRVWTGGVIAHIKRRHYPLYGPAVKKRTRRTLSKGSSAKQGKMVDAQLAASFSKAPKHRMTIAILAHFAALGHTLMACQVPCFVAQFRAITQADCITRDAHGGLHLWEIKTGYPVGGFRSPPGQKTLLHVGGLVPNTKMNHWQAQLRYTQLGLEQHGRVGPFVGANVLQICDHYDKKTRRTDLLLKTHPLADWALAYIK